MIKALATIIILLCVALVTVTSVAAQTDAQREIETATAALQSGDLGRAEAAARAVLAAPANRKNKAIALNVLGIVSDQKQNFAEAEKHYKDSLALDPSFVAARNNLGNLYFKTKRAPQALAQYHIVLRADPAHVEANLNLGLIYEAGNQPALALRHLERARQRAASDARLMLTLANLYFETGQSDRAVKTASELVESSKDARVRFTVGVMLARRGHYKEAAEHFRIVAESEPDSYEAKYNYGLALLNLDRYAEAERALSDAADLKPDLPDAHFRLALVYAATGNSKRATEELTHTIERDDQNSEAHFLLAEEIAKRGQTKEALAHYERAALLAPKTIAYQIKLAEANLKLYRYDRAEAAYKQALAASDPRKGEINYLIGYAARLQGKTAEAVEHFKKQLQITPGHVESLANLGFFEIEMERLPEAEKHLQAAIRLKPNHFAARYDLGRLMIRQRRYAEAEAQLQRVVELKPDHTQAHYQLFLIYSRTNRQTEAKRMMDIFQKLEEEDKREREARERPRG